MADDVYELLPREELEYLRHEVERLKRNPLGDTQASVTLLESMNRLNENVAKLVQVLESANDEMIKVFQENSVQEQLRKLREENAKIAHGIVAIAELVKSAPTEEQAIPQVPQMPRAMPPAPDIQFETPPQDMPTFDFDGGEQNPFAQPNIEPSMEPAPPLPPRR